MIMGECISPSEYLPEVNINFINKVRSLLFQNRYLSNPCWCVNKFVRDRAGEMLANSKIIDVGAGECQYRSYFNHANYVSQDLCVGDQTWDYSRINIKSEIYSIPVDPNSFDYVLCTEVLEHVAFPGKAFQEFQRILKPKGKLFLTVPFVFGEHQVPHDYFRYTRYELLQLAKDHGFSVQQIMPQGGRFQCFSNFLVELIPGFFVERERPFVGYFIKALSYPLIFPLAFVFHYLDKLDHRQTITSHFECIFIRD